ncbi:MAG: class I SAM-dependent methyltransferase [Acidimicrobiales bacterium]
MDHRPLVRHQFGANAANYATSPVHASGASLALVVELLQPQTHWHALDVATAAGHTAFALAPHVATVVASDVTPEMLAIAGAGAAERGLGNVSFEPADAEDLPFADDRFDVVTCRIAAHHFPRPDRFVAEVARVLRPGGRFGLVDNMVDTAASTFVNRLERRRDPSHVRALALEEWLELLTGAGLRPVARELTVKRMVFSVWADNMNVAEEVRGELLEALEHAPGPAAAYLRPELGRPGDQDAAAFHLTEGIIVAEAPA